MFESVEVGIGEDRVSHKQFAGDRKLTPLERVYPQFPLLLAGFTLFGA